MNLLFDIAQLIALLGVIAFYRFYLSDYLKHKAKNLATKEDIKKITDSVESVKAGYAEILEEVKSNYQLKFAAIEREKAIKKEVYMEATEALTRSHNMLASFSNLALSEAEITSGFVDDSGRIAKVQIVGSKETVEAVNAFMAAIGTATMNLMLERGQLIQRKHSIEVSAILRDKSHKEIESYILLMKDLNLAGNKNPDLWDTIKSRIEFEKKQNEKYQKEIDELWSTQTKEHLVFVEKCMNTFFEISDLLPKAVLAVRDELDLEINKDEYLDIFDKDMEKGKIVFKEFLNRIRQNQA